MTKEQTELATTENHDVLPIEQQLLHTPWGAAQELTTDDVLVPRILLVQKMSDMVDKFQAREGEFRDSVSGELLGSETQPLEVVIFSVFQTHVVMKYSDRGKLEFDRIEPVTPENANLPWRTDTEERSHTYNFYLLRALGEQTAGELPYILSLNRSSRRSAQRLNTVFMKLKRVNKPSASQVISFKSRREQNDHGSWMSVDWEIKREATIDELIAARQWHDDIAKRRVNVVVDPNTATEDDIPF